MRIRIKRIATHRQRQQRVLVWLLYCTEGLLGNYAKRLAKKDAEFLNHHQRQELDRLIIAIDKVAMRIRRLMNLI